MRRARPFVYCLVAIVLLLVSACNRSSNVKADLQKKYDAMDAALKARKLEDYAALLAKDYQYIAHDKRTFDRSQAEKSTADLFKSTKEIDSKSTVDEASQTGDRADVTVTTRIKATTLDPRSDKTFNDEVTSVQKDVWHNENGDWKLVQSTETSHTATRDGQPMKPAPSK